MQIKKDEVQKKIISSGRELFMKDGFRKTSMREVARLSEVSTANIYNYFKNKEELFQSVVQVALDSYEKFILECYSKEVWKDESSWTMRAEVERFNGFIDMLYEYESEFILLFSKSEGSKFENYEIKMLDLQCNLSEEVNECMCREEKKFLKRRVPRFIVWSSAKMYMDIIVEGLCSGLDKKEVKKRIEECMYFLFYGYTGYFSDDLQKKQKK